ncbi:MAG: transglutaminase domain-containing protein [Anaerolineales bacterium]|nr:transglutaminase domain-containing protein [Anaerolineales bacterium]
MSKFKAEKLTVDWLAGILIFITVSLASRRLMVTEWTNDLNSISSVAGIAVLAGFFLGISRFSGLLVSGFSVIYGLFVIPWKLCGSYPPTESWHERLVSLGGRLGFTWGQFIHQINVDDPILFLTAMSLLLWIIGFWAGYATMRTKHSWTAILPAAIFILILQFYDPVARRTWYLAFYLFCGMVLIARVYYSSLKEKWEEDQVHLPFFMGLDFLPVPLIIVAALVLFSWWTPAPSMNQPLFQNIWEFLNRPWLEIQSDLEHGFASLRSKVSIYEDFYGDSMSLGTGSDTGDTLLFTVLTPPKEYENMRYYWRVRSYDHYADGRWYTFANDGMAINPEEFQMDVPEYDGRRASTLTFSILQPTNNYPHISELTWFSRPGTITFTPTDEDQEDILSLSPERAFFAGESYKIGADISSMSIYDLRNAGTDYPDYILDTYLQLPENLPARFYHLAYSLSDGLDTPYDIARTITHYLRDNYSYIGKIEAEIPGGQDSVDWFLFDYKQGFCNYYASAEVLLLRMAGVPARLAVGYSQGIRTALGEGDTKPDERLGNRIVAEEFEVYENDAHAWPEVYFPGYGWVEFEPTSSEDSIVRPEGGPPVIEAVSQNEENNPGDTVGDPNDAQNAGKILEMDETSSNYISKQERLLMQLRNWGILLTVLIGSGLLWRYLRKKGMPSMAVLVDRGFEKVQIPSPRAVKNWGTWSEASSLERAYLQINTALTRLSNPPSLDMTPAERSNSLSLLLPKVGDQINLVAEAYQRSLYSTKCGSTAILGSAGRAIWYESQKERWRLFWEKINNFRKR